VALLGTGRRGRISRARRLHLRVDYGSIVK
jgi:hypothetical protein